MTLHFLLFLLGVGIVPLAQNMNDRGLKLLPGEAKVIARSVHKR
tara:strand:- start:535 stop:666 length:132 start_codon:yes stop_codon:yes gene_type:complete